MPPSKHPTYPQSTIHEAVCEVRFSTGRPWEHALSGELFKAVQNEYPTMEPVVQLGVQLEIGPQGLVQTAGPRPLTRYRHREKASLLQLTENSFAISFLSPYPGWQVMKQDFLSAWDLASRALKPERITRLGLRYINRLPAEARSDRVSDWLRTNAYLPTGLLSSTAGFSLRLEVHLRDAERIVVGVTDQLPGELLPIVLDLDRISERSAGPGREGLETWVENLHDEVWEAFNSAKGPKLETFLTRGSQ